MRRLVLGCLIGCLGIGLPSAAYAQIAAQAKPP